MYLARGCNTVEVCPDATGKELFDALKRACSHAKAKLQQIEWPCLVTNGIAYGLAAMHHGGKDHTTLPPWALSVAHAVTARPRDFDRYMIGSVLGLEHKKERLAALEQIEKAHEKDVDVWPESYCYSLWEELKAAWVEELRESRRKLCRILNTDNPRKEDLKFVALAPGSGFKFPKTFDLGHPEGYYQQVCVPRQARALKGIIYGQLHHKRHAPAPKVGEILDENDHAMDTQPSGGGEAGDRVGKGKEKGDKDAKRKKGLPRWQTIEAEGSIRLSQTCTSDQRREANLLGQREPHGMQQRKGLQSCTPTDHNHQGHPLDRAGTVDQKGRPSQWTHHSPQPGRWPHRRRTKRSTMEAIRSRDGCHPVSMRKCNTSSLRKSFENSPEDQTMDGSSGITTRRS